MSRRSLLLLRSRLIGVLTVLVTSADFAAQYVSAQCVFTVSTGFDQDSELTLGEGTPGARVLDDDYTVTNPFGLEATPYTLLTDGFPIPPWLENTVNSLWIVPGTDPDANGPLGLFVYRITFDIEAGTDTSLLAIVGRWAADNSGSDVVINGTVTGITAGGFGAWTEFPSDAGVGLFVEGENSIEFIVNNAPPDGNPTGLRVEACIGRLIPDARPANISTGFNSVSGALFLDGEADTDFTVDGPGTNGAIAATAVPATEFPRVPTWKPNGVNSRWIGLEDPGAVGPAGEYTYVTEVTLPEHIDPAQAVLDGGTAADEEVVEVIVNGESTGFTTVGLDTGELTRFPDDTGAGLFRAGSNTIGFIVNNVVGGPTALRVDGEIIQGPAPVEPIPALFSLETGFDDGDGVTIASGFPDPGWVIRGPQGSRLLEFATVVADDQAPIALPAGPWVFSTERARWIGTAAASSVGPPGDYTFRTVVELPAEIDAAQARIVGRWTSDNGGVDVLVNGVAVGVSPDGNFPSLAEVPPGTGLGLFNNGLNTVEIIVNNAGEGANPVGLFVEAVVGTDIQIGFELLRGDANNDGDISISDASFILNNLFLAGPELPCQAQADANGDGRVVIADPVWLLNNLFLAGPAPPAPFPACGTTADSGDLDLGCDESNCSA